MIRFAAIADIQYGDLDETIGRTYRESLFKFLEATGNFLQNDVVFAMNFGDALQQDWENALAIQELFRVTEKAGISWQHVLGNHDFGVDRQYKSEIYRMFNAPKPGYYDFRLTDPSDSNNRWRWISRYAAETDEQYAKAEAERERCRLANDKLPHNYNGSLSQDQLSWLDETLSEADQIGENVLVCSHFPLYCQTGSLKSDRTKLASLVNVGLYFFTLGVTTWNGQAVLNVLDRHKSVRGYLAGHLHEGAYGVRNNVAHVTFKGVVETNPNAYAFVELYHDRIVVDGRASQPSYEHKFI